MNEITRILLSDMPLAISETGYRYLLATAYPKTFDTLLSDIPLHQPTHGDFVSTTPLYSAAATIPSHGAAATIPSHGAAATVPGDFVAGHPYAAATHSHLRTLAAQAKDIPLTDDFTSESTPDNTIAYHRIFGPILADAYWHFSSKRFEQDLIAAEENPQIIAHLLHVNSPGGEAYYLDRLGETMDNCQKPIIAIIEEACSAAYNIACHAQAIYATTQFDLVGCIGTMVSFYDYTLAKYTELWLRDIAPNKLAKSTIVRDRQEIDRFLPVLGSYKLTELRPEHFRSLYAQLRKTRSQTSGQPLSECTVEGVHACLCGILSDAMEGGYLNHNPAWRTYKYSGKKKEKAVADEETVQKLIAALEEESIKYETYFKLIIATGMRRGECCGLKWSDINYQDRSIHIQRNVVKLTGEEILVKAPKTSAGDRYVYFSAEMESLLQEYRRECAWETESYDRRPLTDDDYIFRRHN